MPTANLPADHPLACPSSLPFLAPPFDRLRDEHWRPAFAEGMRCHATEVRAIADAAEPPTFANTIEALERAGQLLTRVGKAFFHLTEAATTPAIQAIQAEVAPQLAAHHDAIWLDAPLFARVAAVFAARDDLADPERRRLVERYHLAFVRNGAQLAPAAQARLRAINAECSTLQTTFQERLLADTAASAVVVDDVRRLAGLDDGAIAAAAAAAGQPGRWRLDLQLPSSQSALAALQDAGTRAALHAASLARCSRGNDHDTRAVVARLAALRAERAGLFGCASHAEHVLADQMAGSVAAVERLLADLTPAIVTKANAEAAELQAWLDTHRPGTRLRAADWAWVADQVRRSKHGIDDAEVRQHFEFGSVLTRGVFAMARALYGIELRQRHDLPVWHPDVRVFDVLERSGEPLGLFYLDCFARPGKRGGAWMSDFVDQSELLGQRPVVVNVLNIVKAGRGQPTLLGFDEVTTLFHEFGHAVHGLFSRVRHPLLSGTAVPRDFVEFPSQFHEDFAFEPALLAEYARHAVTGAVLPTSTITALRAARRFGQGFASLEYIAAAWLDLEWHSLAPGTTVADVVAFERDALRARGVAHELVPPRYRSAYFAHVWPGGYGAGYYAYLWSEALAADAFATCATNGGMTAGNGARFREHVLSRGMTREPAAMFAAFCGRPLDPRALLARRGLAVTGRS